MAEYVDRSKTQASLYNNMVWYDEDGYMADDSEKDKALWDLINGVPTADVIERKKIDKAIKEMKALVDPKNTILEFDEKMGVKTAMNILVRSIREGE